MNFTERDFALYDTTGARVTSPLSIFTGNIGREHDSAAVAVNGDRVFVGFKMDDPTTRYGVYSTAGGTVRPADLLPETAG